MGRLVEAWYDFWSYLTDDGILTLLAVVAACAIVSGLVSNWFCNHKNAAWADVFLWVCVYFVLIAFLLALLVIYGN